MNPYECMYVIPRDRYRALVGKSPGDSPLSLLAAHSSLPVAQSSLCPVDGRDFRHPNILAHHMKEHVNGVKCNICGMEFKNASSLRKHLRRHRLQAGPGAGSPTARAGPRVESPAARAGPRVESPAAELRCDVCNKKMKHKRNLSRHMKSHKSSFQLKATKWETL